MTTKFKTAINITHAMAALGLITAAAGVILYGIHLQDEIEKVQYVIGAQAIEADRLAEEYPKCIETAIAEYSESWDKACWRNNEESDCMLTILDRYDTEHEFHQDVLGCLAQYK